MSKAVLLLPGDGIGPEVVREARRVLEWADARYELGLSFTEANLGGVAIDRDGVAYPETTRALAREADGILLGAVGGSQGDNLPAEARPERGLLAIRSDLDLFCNLRPAMLFPELAKASSLRAELVSGLDILIVRELTGGIYFGEPRGISVRDDGVREASIPIDIVKMKSAVSVAWPSRRARKRGGRLCSVDKAPTCWKSPCCGVR